jgi:hypothetical protein
MISKHGAATLGFLRVLVPAALTNYGFSPMSGPPGRKCEHMGNPSFLASLLGVDFIRRSVVTSV